MMNYMQNGGLLVLGGAACIVVVVRYIMGERKVKHIAKLRAEADANSVANVGRVIGAHVKDARTSTSKGGK